MLSARLAKYGTTLLVHASACSECSSSTSPPSRVSSSKDLGFGSASYSVKTFLTLVC